MPDFDAANQDRVQRIALHPVRDDPLGNAASAVRLQENGAEAKGFVPIYHFDGTAEPLTSQNVGQMQSSLLTAESDRARFEVIEVQATSSSDEIILTIDVESPLAINNTSITVMIINKMTHLSSELAENGVTEHPFLLESLFVIPINSSQPIMVSNSNISASVISINTSIGIEMNLILNSNASDENLMILVIHEYSSHYESAPRTLSALRIDFNDNPSTTEKSSLPWLAVLTLGAVITWFSRNRRHR